MPTKVNHDDWPFFLKWFYDWSDRTGLTLRNPFKYKYDFVQAWKDKINPKWNEKETKYIWPEQYNSDEDYTNLSNEFDEFLNFLGKRKVKLDYRSRNFAEFEGLMVWLLEDNSAFITEDNSYWLLE